MPSALTMNHKHHFRAALSTFAMAAALATPAMAEQPGKTTIPDFTKGGKIPTRATHDWNLGATGLRGWIFCDELLTSDARQIAITKVDKDSPADGILAVGDVILGVGGKPFSYDPRTEFGKALTLAESAAGGGELVITRLRTGKTAEVVVKLPVFGGYSATAPFDCAKSKRILEQGCKALAEKMAKSEPKDDPIVRSLNALALLASGDPAYLPLVKREAEWAATDFSEDGMKTWYYGYVMLLLSEYVMVDEQSKIPRFAKYSECLAALIRDVRKDLKVPEMPFVIGVMGVGGTKVDADGAAFREAMTAPSLLPEFKGNVAAVQTAPFWSDELAAIDDKRERVDQLRYFLDSKHPDHPNADGHMTDMQKEDHVKSFEAKLISPAEVALWNRGASNAGYHYLGCAKTLALMGKAFAAGLNALTASKTSPTDDAKVQKIDAKVQ